MASIMDRESNHIFSDMDFLRPISVPESDLRHGTNQQQMSTFEPTLALPGNYLGGALFEYKEAPGRTQAYHDMSNLNDDYSRPHDNGMLSNPMIQHFPTVDDGGNIFSSAGGHTTLSNVEESPQLAATFADPLPCDGCTPATKTAIPHHHHPPGRLAGASATLDGHFCCSWLVGHGQPCFLCFESAEALDNHIKNDHAGKDGTYRCLWRDCCKQDNSTNIAGHMNFGSKPKLMRHVHSHTGYKPFRCPYPGCDRGFVTKEQLKNHETTHTKSRKYTCPECGKAFAVKSALTTHITAVHEEKKIHKCDICGKAFADSSNLSKHKQTHFRAAGVRKQRRKRGMSSAEASTRSTRSTPSPPKSSAEPATPYLHSGGSQDYNASPFSPGLMLPPAKLKHAVSNSLSSVFTHSPVCTMSSTSSPPPLSFEGDCYYCEQLCVPPVGPPTPCDEPNENCDLEGFCDLPSCSPTPCNEAEDCDGDVCCDLPACTTVTCSEIENCNREGCCNLPTCFAQNACASTLPPPDNSLCPSHCNEPLLGHHQIEQLRNFRRTPPRDDFMDYTGEDLRSMSHYELEEQFTHMHGS